MPRDIPVGNGDLLITFDRLYRVRDLYFPHVGSPNHTDGHVQRFGVWADGEFAWIEDASWERRLGYRADTLVTEVHLTNQKLGVEVVCHDAVDFSDPVYFRRVVVRDLRGAKGSNSQGAKEPNSGQGPLGASGGQRDIRLFFHFDPSIRGSSVGDTANYDPAANALVMYKDDAYFLVNASDGVKVGVDHWAIGTKRLGGAEGTWRDAEDGILGRNAISQGSVDATIGFSVPLEPGGTGSVTLWVACGASYHDVKVLNKRIVETDPGAMLARTEAYWRLWARKEPIDLSPLPATLRDLFVRSQLVIRTQIDNRGAILAANDSDVTAFGGDHYSYCWMRDGALVAYSLILAGHGELSRNFFRFAASVVEPEGYFLHKYAPTGRLASSWHPWMIEGQRVLPIQQDETSLVMWALRRHFEAFRDVEFIKPVYEPLIIRAAEWTLSYRDSSGLPLPSWDLWEERRGIHTFTVAATIGGLRAAAAFARDFGEVDRAARYAEQADVMREALRRHLWNPQAGRFARMATPVNGSGYRLDMTHDSANYALFAFGALDARDPMVESEMRALRERLWVQTDVGGCARYERDYFHQVERERTDTVPGNPWVICTLWHAQHAIARATTRAELEAALPYLEWAAGRAFESGVLAEQFHPYTGAPIGVSPLTWSHATVVMVVMEYLRKLAEVSHGPARAPRAAEVETEVSALP